jgi:hypothetical protein
MEDNVIVPLTIEGVKFRRSRYNRQRMGCHIRRRFLVELFVFLGAAALRSRVHLPAHACTNGCAQ